MLLVEAQGVFQMVIVRGAKEIEEGISSGKWLVQKTLVSGLLIDVSLANNIRWKVTQMVKSLV